MTYSNSNLTFLLFFFFNRFQKLKPNETIPEPVANVREAVVGTIRVVEVEVGVVGEVI